MESWVGELCPLGNEFRGVGPESLPGVGVGTLFGEILGWSDWGFEFCVVGLDRVVGFRVDRDVVSDLRSARLPV